MKSVLISIQPKWVEKIISGKKTIEVRKTRPKIETPFKCYIYCTNRPFDITDIQDLNVESVKKTAFGRGKVIGEFVCNKIAGEGETVRGNACLTVEELQDYCNGKDIYFWHISDLKIYDKPKELSEFKTIKLIERSTGFNRYEKKAITRPFQSWGYIEDIDRC